MTNRQTLASRHNAIVDELEAMQRRMLRLKKTQSRLQSDIQSSGTVSYRTDGRVEAV